MNDDASTDDEWQFAEPGTAHVLWQPQAREDLSTGAQALANLATLLDEDVASWEGVTPVDLARRLTDIRTAVSFLAQLAEAATASR